MRTKEHEARLAWRTRLAECKGSKRFWQQIALVDRERIERVCVRLNGGKGSTTPSIKEFAEHFARIAVPPTCPWFNDGWLEVVEAVVRQSLKDTSGLTEPVDDAEHAPAMSMSRDERMEGAQNAERANDGRRAACS